MRHFTPSKIQHTAAGYRTYQYKNVRPAYNHEMQQESLGYRLAVWMDVKGITINDLAKVGSAYGAMNGTKLTYRDIYNYIHGKYCPKTEKLYLLSRATGMSERWLQGYGDIRYGLMAIETDAKRDAMIKRGTRGRRRHIGPTDIGPRPTAPLA